MSDRPRLPRRLPHQIRKSLAALWTVLIVVLCTIPGDDLPDVDLFSADKIGHFVMFAALGWLWMWATKAAFRRSAAAVLVVGLLFAGATEIYQGILPVERQPSWADALANALGLTFGIWVAAKMRTSRT